MNTEHMSVYHTKQDRENKSLIIIFVRYDLHKYTFFRKFII